jgi:hypothetical protein
VRRGVSKTPRPPPVDPKTSVRFLASPAPCRAGGAFRVELRPAVMQDQLQLPRGGVAPRRSGRARAGGGDDDAGDHRPRRRAGHRPRARGRQGARRADRRRLGGDGWRRQHAGAAGAGPFRLREPLPPRHRRPAALGEGCLRRRPARGPGPRGRPRRAVERRPGRPRTSEGRVRLTAARAGHPPPPRRRPGTRGARPRGASTSRPSPATRCCATAARGARCRTC